MAIQNYLTNYVGSEDLLGNPIEAAPRQSGVRLSFIQNTVSPLSTDSSTSTYLLVKNLQPAVILTRMDLEVDANTGGTSYSIGLYDAYVGGLTSTPTALAAGCYMNSVDIHAGSTFAAPINGIQALTHENTMQPAYILAGQTLFNAKAYYDLVLTANTAASTAFNLTARIYLIPAG